MEAQFSDILDAINMKDFKDAPYSLAAINGLLPFEKYGSSPRCNST